MVASRVDPYLGFLVNMSDPLFAMIVMELRNGLNCPKERPLIGKDVPGCHMMLMILSWGIWSDSMSTCSTCRGEPPIVMPVISDMSSVGLRALTVGSIGAVVLRWLWSGMAS